MEFLIEKCASGSCVNDVDVPKFVSHGKNFKLDYHQPTLHRISAADSMECSHEYVGVTLDSLVTDYL